MNFFVRQVRAAQGWLELGCPAEAQDELRQIEPPLRDHTEVLSLRSAIYECTECWGEMESIADQLRRRHPEDPSWPLLQADAARRAYTAHRAALILETALQCFPGDAMIHFNLARHLAHVGEVEAARGHLAEALRIELECFQMAMNDPDLATL